MAAATRALRALIRGVLTVGKGKNANKSVEIPELNLKDSKTSEGMVKDAKSPEGELKNPLTMSLMLIKAVKPHIPLINFHPRLQAGKVAVASNTPQTQDLKPAAPATSKPVGNTERGSGLDDTELPSKYRRKPLTQEEMEFIERGGPN